MITVSSENTLCMNKIKTGLKVVTKRRNGTVNVVLGQFHQAIFVVRADLRQKICRK